MSDKLPWFPFYVSDWLLDEKVRRMGFAERGIYFHLLCLQWVEGSIPKDLADLKLSLSIASADQVSDAMIVSVIGRCFRAVEGEPHRLENSRLSEIQAKQRVTRQAKSDGGRKGGLSSAQAKLKHSRAEQRRTEKTKDKDVFPKDGNGTRETWLSPYLALHLEHSGNIEPGELAKALRPVYNTLGATECLKHFRSFLLDSKHRAFGVRYFQKHFRDFSPVPFYLPNGEGNPLALQRLDNMR